MREKLVQMARTFHETETDLVKRSVKLGEGKITYIVSAHFRYVTAWCFSIWQAILT
jgi:hypothetical protein